MKVTGLHIILTVFVARIRSDLTKSGDYPSISGGAAGGGWGQPAQSGAPSTVCSFHPETVRVRRCSAHESTRSYYQKSLGLNEGSEWIKMQWDLAHLLDLAENDARTAVKQIETALALAQEISKFFRYDVQYGRAFGGPAVPCVSLTDPVFTDSEDADRAGEFNPEDLIDEAREIDEETVEDDRSLGRRWN